MLSKLRSRGDTMIEVMLCLIVAGVVFGAAFTTARRSTISITTARERIVALKLAEDQAEFIRAQSVARTVAQTPFCFDPTTATIASGSCTSNFYTIKIELEPGSPVVGGGITTYTYKISVTWPALGSKIENNLSINYVYAQ